MGERVMNINSLEFNSIEKLRISLVEHGIKSSSTTLSRNLSKEGEEIVLTPECKVLYFKYDDKYYLNIITGG
jgi:hypothetical protein